MATLTHHGKGCSGDRRTVGRSLADRGDERVVPRRIDLVEPGFIEFTEDGTGQFGFIAVRGWLDCRPAERDGQPGVEFTWEGIDEGDQISGRGWASLIDDATVEGHLYFHMGDDSNFRAEPFTPTDRLDGQ
jgi:hypothetical protein